MSAEIARLGAPAGAAGKAPFFAGRLRSNVLLKLPARVRPQAHNAQAQPAKTTSFAGGPRSNVLLKLPARVRRRRTTRRRSRQKPRFLPAAYGVMSAEIARGNFSQLNDRAR
jgi:hypothetical protein